MKKLLLIALTAIMMAGCTEQTNVKNFGQSGTINLPKGQKLIEVTWKDANLWYLTETMDSDYIPKTKVFTEDSEWDIFEGSITFVESR